MAPSSYPQPCLDRRHPHGPDQDQDHAAAVEDGLPGLDPDLDPGVETVAETDPGIGIGAEIDPGIEIEIAIADVAVGVAVVVDPGIEVEVGPGIVFAIVSVTWPKSVRNTQA
jgi:hypothetical protein